MTFKIFETLIGTSDTDVSLDKRFCATINRLPMEHREIIYVLIYHYYTIHLTKESKSIDIPYQGKIGTKGKGVGFEANNLPLNLQRIIVNYLTAITS